MRNPGPGRRLLLVALFSFLPLAAAPPSAVRAQETKPNMLTPKEVSDGWLLLFDGETTFGWKAEKEGAWTVAADGTLGAKEIEPGALTTTSEWGDVELRFEVSADAGRVLQVSVGQNQETLRPARTWQPVRIRRENGRFTQVSAPPAGAVNRRLTRPAEGVAPAANVRGPIRLSVGPGAGGVRLRNVALRPLGLKPIFNGKDLTGWKEIPDRKSVYSVTPEGWLNVKNGNGDLQTEASWGDFVLQLGIISNGTHLNSGVFFRAAPGRFWSGYEAQIRNQWQGDDRTKPVDYGTGGLYNRQPARKVVSTDREWFTMTVVANGLHFATWVDGYPVADFTDMRLPNEENARSGARTKAGVLSLQGHDPTTDLSFRDIRIVELPK